MLIWQKRGLDTEYSKEKLAICCSGLLPVRHSEKTTWKDLATDGQDGRKQAPTLILAKDSIRGKEKRGDPPLICERGWDGNTNRGEYPSMCQVGINVRMSWQALLSLPSHPSSHTNTLLPCLEHMVHQQRHLATLTPGSCASSSPVGSLGTATSSTTCGSSWVKRRAMNYSEAAAANLTFIQETGCKHMTASRSTCHPHTNARLATWLVSCTKGPVCPCGMAWFVWGKRSSLDSDTSRRQLQAFGRQEEGLELQNIKSALRKSQM